MLKGVLFDLGSTLQEFRSEDWPSVQRQMTRGLYEYLHAQGHGQRLPPLDEFIEMMVAAMQANWDYVRTTGKGRSLLSLLPDLFTRYDLQGVSPDECLLPWYGYRITDLVYVEPDVKPTLEALSERGLRLGLVSNTTWPAAAHDPDLARFGILHLLPCRLYSCEFGWEKPDPRIFLAALDCLGLEAEEVAFVGDFLRYDVAGAHAVGMKAVWKRVEGRPPEADDLTIMPDATITRISELPAALDKLYNSEA